MIKKDNKASKATEAEMVKDLMAWVEWQVEGWLYRRTQVGRVMEAGR